MFWCSSASFPVLCNYYEFVKHFPDTRPTVFYISSLFLFIKIQFRQPSVPCLGRNGHLPCMRDSHIPHEKPFLTSRDDGHWIVMTPSDKWACLCCALAKQVILHLVDFLRSDSHDNKQDLLTVRFRWCALGLLSAERCVNTVGSTSWGFFIPGYWVSVDFLLTSECWPLSWISNFFKRQNVNGNGIMLTNVKWKKKKWKRSDPTRLIGTCSGWVPFWFETFLFFDLWVSSKTPAGRRCTISSAEELCWAPENSGKVNNNKNNDDDDASLPFVTSQRAYFQCCMLQPCSVAWSEQKKRRMREGSPYDEGPPNRKQTLPSSMCSAPCGGIMELLPCARLFCETDWTSKHHSFFFFFILSRLLLYLWTSPCFREKTQKIHDIKNNIKEAIEVRVTWHCFFFFFFLFFSNDTQNWPTCVFRRAFYRP